MEKRNKEKEKLYLVGLDQSDLEVLFKHKKLSSTRITADYIVPALETGVQRYLSLAPAQLYPISSVISRHTLFLSLSPTKISMHGQSLLRPLQLSYLHL